MSRPTSKPRLALDIETHGDIDVLHPQERPLVCVGFFDGSEAAIIPRSLLGPADYEGDDWAWPELLREMALWDLELHNGIFDIPTLASRLTEKDVDPESYGIEIGFDTQLAHYALRPAAEQGLKPLAKNFFDVDDWDQIASFERLGEVLANGDRDWYYENVFPVSWEVCDVKKMDMKRLADYPELLVQLYNGYDVLYTWMLRDFLMPFLEHHEDVARASTHLHSFANMIMWDQLEGFPVEVAKAGRMCTFLQEQVDSSRTTLVEWAHTYLDPATLPGGQFNPNSPKQIQRLYASVGKKLAKTDKEVMTKLAEKGDKFAAKLLEHRSWVKELSTYALKARDDTNSIHGEPRLYPWYRLVATLTGRLSSGGVTNIQNWSKQEERPHEDRLRSVLVPTSLRSEPSVLVQVDYGQAELRVAAALSQDQWLIEQFADESTDIFTKMTTDIFPDLTDPRQIKLWRRPLKSVVYGLMFARGAGAIALELGIPVAQAQSIINQFLTKAHSYAELRKQTARAAVTGKPIVTRYGRHFQHEIVHAKNRAAVQRSALSFLPQSSASDTTLVAYMNLRSIAKERGWIFRALVHDAITYDVPLSQAQECIDITSAHMIEAGNTMFPEVKWAVDGNYAIDWSRTG